MVVYSGQAGATVTRGCAGLNWLGGELMGKGRFAISREIAGFIGISSRLRPYCVAFSDTTVTIKSEAVHSKVSDFAATVVSHFLSGPVSTVGSLYSGAFDELGTGCQGVFSPGCGGPSSLSPICVSYAYYGSLSALTAAMTTSTTLTGATLPTYSWPARRVPGFL